MSEASDLCPFSKSTVEVVESCPDNEEKWAEAAARKNCEKYASQCDEPERLVYHCVINPYVNQTLEVCAYAQNIPLGQCTEYNFQGNLIQPNGRTNCMAFDEHPCPEMYRSTEAYKYPKCYELTKRPDTGDSGSRGHGKGGNILFTALLLIVVTLVVD